VLRLDRADAVTLYAIRASGEIEITGHLIGDAPSAAEDGSENLERSRLICTIRQGARVKGAVWLTSTEAEAFTEEHQELLEPSPGSPSLKISRPAGTDSSRVTLASCFNSTAGSWLNNSLDSKGTMAGV
jgi:hypothetical protein